MKRINKLIASFIAVVSLGLALGQSAFARDSFPSLEPYFLYENKTPQTLSGEEMALLGIKFSVGEGQAGVDISKVVYYLDKYRTISNYVKTPEVMKLDEKKRAEKVLSIMYQRVLKKYDENQTRVDVALESGTYNCVSASVIYAALAKEAGLTVKGQMAPEHCFCSVYVDGKKIDVETTNPAGFEPGTKKLSSDSRYYVVSQQHYDGRVEISDSMLVSLVAKNLASLYNDDDDFYSAIPLAVTRREFLSNDATAIDDAASDFETLCSNYVVVLNNQGKFTEVLDWMKLVHKKYDYESKLQQVFENAVYNCIAVSCEKKDIASAIAIFDGNKYLLRDGARKNLEEILLLSRAQYETDLMSPKDAIEYLHELKKNPGAQNFRSKNQIDSWLEYYWLLVVQEQFDKELYLEGARQAQLGLKDLPSNKNLKSAYSMGLNNYDVTVHNQFARYANSGNITEARKCVEEGLKNHPDSTVLKDDLKLLQKFE